MIISPLPNFRPQSEELLDQQQTDRETQFSIQTGQWIGQIFTANKSGLLSKIKLWLGGAFYLGEGGNFTFEIQGVTNNKPNGNVFAVSRVWTVEELADPASERIITFLVSPIIYNGTKYAMVCKNSLTAWTEIWISETLYANGSMYVSTDEEATWDIYNYSLYFKTYVTV